MEYLSPNYDGNLDAWVGLCLHEEGAGYVFFCDVLSPAECETMPVWKLGMDEVFDANSVRHLGATLVYMGGSTFCLVECQAHRDDEELDCPRHRVVQITAFGLKYDKKGDLRTTSHRARASMSYKVAHEKPEPTLDPVAFCI